MKQDGKRISIGLTLQSSYRKIRPWPKKNLPSPLKIPR